jgi:ABC-2 type transport system ATP-binding protein
MGYLVTNLSKDFKDKLALHDVSFSIKDGEIISILGKNGAGKTTLIKILTGLLNKTSGDVFYNDINLIYLKSSYYKSIGVVLEGDRNTYWYLSGLENILYFGRLHKMNDSEIHGRAEKLLKHFSLYDDRKKKVSHYSRGMKQKLSIIIGLINNPKVLFLDEPTLGLDVWSKNSLIELIQSYVVSHNITVIMTSHQLDIVESLAKRVILLDEGKIMYDGDIQKLIGNEDSIYEIVFYGDISLVKKIGRGLRLISQKKEEEANCVRVEADIETILNFSQTLIQEGCKIEGINKVKRSLEQVILNNWGVAEHDILHKS